MLVTTDWVKKNYEKFNELYFNGMLPEIKFKTNRSKNMWGFAQYRIDLENDTIIPESITISNYYDSPENVKIQVLLHEMIHIEDYFWHPEHFIKNGRRITKRQYDAHGTWFKNEALRISKESGYVVTNHVTRDEINSSKYSTHTRKLLDNKANNALICALYGNNGKIWFFKTDINKASYVKNIGVHRCRWNYTLEGIHKIKFYKFESQYFANLRSCHKSYPGWLADRMSFMHKMETIKATEVHIN